MHRSSLGYLIAVGVPGAVLAWLLRDTATVTLIGFAGATMVVAVPIWVVAALVSAARSAHDTALFRERTLWRLAVNGHVLRMLLAVIPALLGGAGIVLSLVVDTQRTVLLGLAGAALTPLVARWVAGRVAAPVLPAQQVRFLLPLTIGITGAALMLGSLALRGAAVPLAEMPRYGGSSPLLGQATDLWAIWTALGNDMRAGAGPWGWLVALVLDGSLAFALATALAAPLVRWQELRRILRPSQNDTAPAPGPVSIAVMAFIGVVLPVVLLGTLADVEGGLARVTAQTQAPTLAPAGDGATQPPIAPGPMAPARSGPAPFPLPSAARESIEREQVGDALCPPGTIALLQALDDRHRDWRARQDAELARLLGAGFDTMRGNVPEFLDWYYSLGAEYLRTFNLLVGSGEAYLQDQTLRLLAAEAAFADFAVMAELLSAGPGVADQQLVTDRAATLRACGLALPQDGGPVVITGIAPPGLVALPTLTDRIPLGARLGSAGLVGAGAAAVIAGKFGGKLVVSGAFKLAATAIAKIAGSKALTFLGGAGAGALGGGAAGSVVPGAGTAAGAIVGGIVGAVAVTLGVDFTILKLEEAVSREDFAADLFAAIDATEAEVLGQLGLTGPD